MNYFNISIRRLCYLLAFILLSTFSCLSGANSIVLTPVTDINLNQAMHWQSVYSYPGNSKSFLLVSELGDVYISSSGEISSLPILSLKQISEHATKLTAVALHPNFSLRDQPGFHTFYTAHVEPININLRKTRLQDVKAKVKFDMVISEWQILNKTLDTESHREIIRIGSPSEASYISQLSFSPLSKVWNDDFGLLYVALSSDPEYVKLPLYSGAILRLDPKRFGLRNYTVPTSNPFLTQNEIDNELFAIGLQQLIGFIWPDKNDNHLLVEHGYNNESNLSLINPGGDYRNGPPRDVLYTSKDPFTPNGLINYSGRALPHLWGAVLFVTRTNEQSQLYSLAMPDSTGKKRMPILEWRTERSSLNDNERVVLFPNANQEILVLNNVNQELSQLVIEPSDVAPPVDDVAIEVNENNGTNSNKLFIVLIVIVIVVVIAGYWRIQKRRGSVLYQIRQQFGGFEVSESNQHISLYKRHKKTAEVTLLIEDIAESIISLNDLQLSVISNIKPFSQSKEANLREHFSQEKREKMVSSRIRQLTLELTDKEGHQYLICAYLRKGDNRITRMKYTQVIEKLIDWSWSYSQTVAADTTKERPPKVTTVSKCNPALEGLLKPDYDASTTRIADQNRTEQNVSEPYDVKRHKVEQPSENFSAIEAEPATNTASVIISEARLKADADLVIALEKLAQLKQQGMLTEQEYQSAKQKILEDLLN